MSKQIFIAHSGGAQGSPGQGSHDFVEWLSKSLGNGYEIQCPIIEDPEAPEFSMWKSMFNHKLANLTGEVILIGHSLGGSMLLKYISEEETNLRIKGLLLISVPYWGRDGWNVNDFTLKGNFQNHLPELRKVHLYHCLNDPIVPCDHMKHYQTHFTDAIAHQLSGNDHAFKNGLQKVVETIKSLE